MPTAHVDAGAALSRTVLRMYSVEPLSSAACTHVERHFGMHDHADAGMLARAPVSICFAVKRTCTEQWPFHRISFARVELRRASRPPNGSCGSHTTI